MPNRLSRISAIPKDQIARKSSPFSEEEPPALQLRKRKFRRIKTHAQTIESQCHVGNDLACKRIPVYRAEWLPPEPESPLGVNIRYEYESTYWDRDGGCGRHAADPDRALYVDRR